MDSTNSRNGQWDRDALRTRFCMEMSEMYRQEVPLYGDLLSIVAAVDDQVSEVPLPARHRVERHGAIRLGTGHEMRIIARLFALFDMHPVGYYDLSVVGFPLHATAFRPLTSSALAQNPFRVFTSVLRRELLPADARQLVDTVLSKRNLFTERLMGLLEKAEKERFLAKEDENELMTEALEIFRWHSTANVSQSDYVAMNAAHPMVADIASFPSAHINHLTPRTLDIDEVQETMARKHMPYKDRIEGPPRRQCSILLRQTSFRALEEQVRFIDQTGQTVDGHHTARFGEVEQRGAALTKQGRKLYDEFLRQANTNAAANGGSEQDYQDALHRAFRDFPDNWADLRSQKLVFFRYSAPANRPQTSKHAKVRKLSELLEEESVQYERIIYEDFLPISAAGIFTSNLKGASHKTVCEGENGDISLLEQCIGTKIMDPTTLYEEMENESLKQCCDLLGLDHITLD